MDAIVPHAYQRWTTVVLLVCASRTDVTTLSQWARMAGVSASWLRTWCYAAGVTPKASLDFARMLRLIVYASQMGDWDLLNLLDVADRRTLHRLFMRGGVEAFLDARRPPTLEAFFKAQHFVANERLLLHLAAHRPLTLPEQSSNS